MLQATVYELTSLVRNLVAMFVAMFEDIRKHRILISKPVFLVIEKP